MNFTLSRPTPLEPTTCQDVKLGHLFTIPKQWCVYLRTERGMMLVGSNLNGTDITRGMHEEITSWDVYQHRPVNWVSKTPLRITMTETK